MSGENEMNTLRMIEEAQQGNLGILKSEPWLRFLYFNESVDCINMDNFDRVESRTKNAVLEYVKKTLSILQTIQVTSEERGFIEQVLIWSEVSKCGNKAMRASWKEKGYNLSIHNIGSAQIFQEYAQNSDKELVRILIETHGYIGQVLRGEVRMSENQMIYDYVQNHPMKVSLTNILQGLNQCIIQAVSPDLYTQLREDINKKIEDIQNGNLDELLPEERLRRLRTKAIQNGEDFEREWGQLTIEYQELKEKVYKILNQHDLWYVEAATSSYRLEHVVKLLLIADLHSSQQVTDFSFIDVMNTIYYDYHGYKRVNVYKARIIEHLLDSIPFTELDGRVANEHLEVVVTCEDGIARVQFQFSKMSNALIDFCMASEGQGSIYDKAIIMLYDLFGLRRDAYDRFNNEDNYLKQMNQSIGFKEILLDYVIGQRIVDIGPGGGALMDRLEERYPEKQILGIDISENVIEELNRKRNREHKKWEVFQGNALDLAPLFQNNPVDTIILSSIVHELFSYIELDNRQFNYDTLKKAFRSMYDVLNVGGRIVIRDGVMSEPKEAIRQIHFKNSEDRKILDDYCRDFKGREITYTELAPDLVAMKINDAMEFLFTFTWGKESYSHEVEEQFGYFTPTEYHDFFNQLFGKHIKVIEIRHYLQEGYAEHLLPKIDFLDENGQATTLPDSTILLVIEKTEKS